MRDAERLREDPADRGQGEGLLHRSSVRPDVRNPERSLAYSDSYDLVTAHDPKPVLPVVEATTEGSLDRRQVRLASGDGRDRAADFRMEGIHVDHVEPADCGSVEHDECEARSMA